MREITISGLQPDLVVCSTAAGASGTACGNANETLSDSAPMVVYSLGRDCRAFSSADELEKIFKEYTDAINAAAKENAGDAELSKLQAKAGIYGEALAKKKRGGG